MQPDVTFVMPAYNVEDYIEAAVNSLKAQSEEDWLLIIVNDGSTDKTREIAQSLANADSRISIIDMEAPSGSVYQPRKRAILAASTEFVAPLDADDWVERDYLKKLRLKYHETSADIIYPTLYIEKNGTMKAMKPLEDFFFVETFSGKDCVKYTLDNWQISCGGGLLKKSVYEQAFSTFDSSLTYSFADELLSRQILFLAKTVAFSDAKYFYRTNNNSITHKKSLKLFHYIFNNKILIDFTESNFPAGSEEIKLAHRQNFHGMFDALRLLEKYDFSDNEKRQALKIISDVKDNLNYDFLKDKVSRKYFYLSKLPLPFIRNFLSFYDGAARFLNHKQV